MVNSVFLEGREDIKMSDKKQEEAITEEEIKSYSESINKIMPYILSTMLYRLSLYFREKRKQKGISLRALNKLSGVSISVINDLENGNSIPRIETLIRLGLALSKDLDEVFMLLLEEGEIKKQTPITKRLQLIKLLQGIGCSQENIYEVLNFIHFKSLFNNGLLQGFDEKEAEIIETSVKDIKEQAASIKNKMKKLSKQLKN